MNTTTHSLVGSIVRDTTVTTEAIRYAVGKDGFMDLQHGKFVTYDSAFPGPEFFERPEFAVEYSEKRNMSDDAAEALDTMHWRYTQFAEAKTPVAQAYALTDLHDAIGALITWHPGYQYEYEHAMMPWQRTEAD